MRYRQFLFLILLAAVASCTPSPKHAATYHRIKSGDANTNSSARGKLISLHFPSGTPAVQKRITFSGVPNAAPSKTPFLPEGVEPLNSEKSISKVELFDSGQSLIAKYDLDTTESVWDDDIMTLDDGIRPSRYYIAWSPGAHTIVIADDPEMPHMASTPK